MTDKRIASNDQAAFDKFMSQLLSGVVGVRPDFAKGSVHSRKSTQARGEGDGYAGTFSVKDMSEGQDCSGCSGCSSEGWDGKLGRTSDWSNLKGTKAAGFFVDEYFDGEDGDDEAGDDEADTAEYHQGEAVSTITISIRGPGLFVEEIAQDINDLLKDLRVDALQYALEEFQEDADELVSVTLHSTTSVA